MKYYKLGIVEMEFSNIIWENEPIASGELVKLCLNKLEWKKSTTYTTLKKLSEKGIFQNEKGVVTSLLSKEEYTAMQSEKFVEETFSGSLPRFLASFVSKKDLSREEIEEIYKIIEKGGQ
ncbi:MAG: BlaI/MecI/CopY family transcriptional regulator [Clostridia bacterium]